MRRQFRPGNFRPAWLRNYAPPNRKSNSKQATSNAARRPKLSPSRSCAGCQQTLSLQQTFETNRLFHCKSEARGNRRAVTTDSTHLDAFGGDLRSARRRGRWLCAQSVSKDSELNVRNRKARPSGVVRPEFAISRSRRSPEFRRPARLSAATNHRPWRRRRPSASPVHCHSAGRSGGRVRRPVRS